jgi:hypothetical protein
VSQRRVKSDNIGLCIYTPHFFSFTRAVESESEGILGGVGFGKKRTDSDINLKC